MDTSTSSDKVTITAMQEDPAQDKSIIYQHIQEARRVDTIPVNQEQVHEDHPEAITTTQDQDLCQEIQDTIQDRAQDPHQDHQVLEDLRHHISDKMAHAKDVIHHTSLVNAPLKIISVVNVIEKAITRDAAAPNESTVYQQTSNLKIRTT